MFKAAIKREKSDARISFSEREQARGAASMFIGARSLRSWSFVKINFKKCQNRHYNKYFIFIYSEQMTQSRNENDHFDLDHFDQAACLFLILVDSFLLFS